MKIIVKSPCFIKGELLEPGKNGAAVEVSNIIGKAAITAGRATLAPKESKKSSSSKSKNEETGGSKSPEGDK